jgi:hypothetical protein
MSALSRLSTDVTSAALAKELGCDRIMSFAVWRLLANIGETTAKRLIASGRGPRITYTSERCMGVRVSDHVAWLDACSNNNTEKTRPVNEAGRVSTLQEGTAQQR